MQNVMENEKLAMAKGFIHAIALPFLLTVILSNVFIGIGWIMFVSYLYTRVLVEKKVAAYWFFAFAKGLASAVIIYLLVVLVSVM